MIIYIYIYCLSIYIYIHNIIYIIYIYNKLYTILYILPAHAEQLGVSTGPRLSMPGQLPQGPPKALCDLQQLTTYAPHQEKCELSVEKFHLRSEHLDRSRPTYCGEPSQQKIPFFSSPLSPTCGSGFSIKVHTAM